VECQLINYGDNLVADFSLDITNQSAEGYAGDLVTYCLFPEGSNVDERHWEVLSLAGGDTQRSTVRFQHLQDGQTYTLKVRCPWSVKRQLTFTALRSEATDGVEPMAAEKRPDDNDIYDLGGRRVGTSHSVLPKGIYIKHGKKLLIP